MRILDEDEKRWMKKLQEKREKEEKSKRGKEKEGKDGKTAGSRTEAMKRVKESGVRQNNMRVRKSKE